MELQEDKSVAESGEDSGAGISISVFFLFAKAFPFHS
jgi:hypothetical protein